MDEKRMDLYRQAGVMSGWTPHKDAGQDRSLTDGNCLFGIREKNCG